MPIGIYYHMTNIMHQIDDSLSALYNLDQALAAGSDCFIYASTKHNCIQPLAFKKDLNSTSFASPPNKQVNPLAEAAAYLQTNINALKEINNRASGDYTGNSSDIIRQIYADLNDMARLETGIKRAIAQLNSGGYIQAIGLDLDIRSIYQELSKVTTTRATIIIRAQSQIMDLALAIRENRQKMNDFLDRLSSAESTDVLRDVLRDVLNHGYALKAQAETLQEAIKRGDVMKEFSQWSSLDRETKNFIDALKSGEHRELNIPRRVRGALLANSSVSGMANQFEFVEILERKIGANNMGAWAIEPIRVGQRTMMVGQAALKMDNPHELLEKSAKNGVKGLFPDHIKIRDSVVNRLSRATVVTMPAEHSRGMGGPGRRIAIHK